MNRWKGFLLCFIYGSSLVDFSKSSKIDQINESNLNGSMGPLLVRIRRSNSGKEIEPPLNDIIDPTVIGNPVVTKYGDWGEWRNCSEDFAIGFQLKIQEPQGWWDDSAVNSIRLICRKSVQGRSKGSRAGGHRRISYVTEFIETADGGQGKWGNRFVCGRGMVLTGFQMNSEPWHKKDNTGANNIRGFCSPRRSGGRGQELEGDGTSFGVWTEAQRCERGSAICAIKTQVQTDPEVKDRSGLNNLMMRCCALMEDCEARDEWEAVTVCNNLKGHSPLRCSFSKSIGVSLFHSSTEGRSETRTSAETQEANLNLGFSLIQPFPVSFGVELKSKFMNNRTVSENWASTSSDTWRKESTHSASFEVPAGSFSTLYQLVGHCGNLVVHSARFRKEDRKIQ